MSRLPADEMGQGLKEEELTQLARWDLNGREIKNLIETVKTWCVCKGFGMSLEKFDAGIRSAAPQAVKQPPLASPIHQSADKPHGAKGGRSLGE